MQGQYSLLAAGKDTRPWGDNGSVRSQANPDVDSPIIGATKPHHLADAVAALDIVLTDAEAAALEAAYVPCTPTYFN